MCLPSYIDPVYMYIESADDKKVPYYGNFILGNLFQTIICTKYQRHNYNSTNAITYQTALE